MFRLIFTLVFLALMCAPAMATVDISWDDHLDTPIHYWPGWSSSSQENSKDVIGDPMYNGGTFSLDGDKLTKITLNYTNNNNIWGAEIGGERFVAPGDLFIDADMNGSWDHVARSNFQGNALDWAFYELNTEVALNSATGYRKTSGDPSGYDIRNNHPFALAGGFDGSQKGTVWFAGLPYPDGAVEETFWDLSNVDLNGDNDPDGGLDVLSDGNGFTFAFAARCTNDVVLENFSIATQQEVPLPGAVWLFGSGLLGLVALRRRNRA